MFFLFYRIYGTIEDYDFNVEGLSFVDSCAYRSLGLLEYCAGGVLRLPGALKKIHDDSRKISFLPNMDEEIPVLKNDSVKNRHLPGF